MGLELKHVLKKLLLITSESNYFINNMDKGNFDPRSEQYRDITQNAKESLLNNIRKTIPNAVKNISYAPPKCDDVLTPSLIEIAENICASMSEASFADLIDIF